MFFLTALEFLFMGDPTTRLIPDWSPDLNEKILADISLQGCVCVGGTPLLTVLHAALKVDALLETF